MKAVARSGYLGGKGGSVMLLAVVVLALILPGCDVRHRLEGEILGRPDFGDCHTLILDEDTAFFENGGIVVRNAEDYAALRRNFLGRMRDSSACTMPAVDFGTTSILGKGTRHVGTEFAFCESVRIYPAAKKCFYSISVVDYEVYSGHCMYAHYVLVPAVPEDYDVIFLVED
jgi:hypothetical protein